MLTTYDQAIRPTCHYGAKVCNDYGKYRARVNGDDLVALMDANGDVESWHLGDCPCGRGDELPDWAKF